MATFNHRFVHQMIKWRIRICSSREAISSPLKLCLHTLLYFHEALCVLQLIWGPHDVCRSSVMILQEVDDLYAPSTFWPARSVWATPLHGWTAVFPNVFLCRMIVWVEVQEWTSCTTEACWSSWEQPVLSQMLRETVSMTADGSDTCGHCGDWNTWTQLSGWMCEQLR